MQRLRKAAQQTIASSIRKTTNGLRLATDLVIANINDWWPQLAAVVVTGGISALLVFIVPQQSWLPKASDSRVLLGSLLGAQAAIAALTLAVTLFVMQGISNRQDADDRIYREYVKRSKVKGIFRNSLLSVATTGVILLIIVTLSGSKSTSSALPALSNLTIVAFAGFLLNLTFAEALFEVSIRLSTPTQWIDLRRSVNERDVRRAIQVFLRRLLRAAESLRRDDPDITTIVPDAGEGSADEAVRDLLDEARRFMREERQGEFSRSMESIKVLLMYAIEEMEKTDYKWGPPGTYPEWPPLRQLGRNLYSFREDIFRQGSRDYVLELRSLDHWLARTGIKRQCGEMFTTALEGYRFNYNITAQQESSGFREIFRNEFSVVANELTYGLEAEKIIPYIRHMTKVQEGMLSDAMHRNNQEDFRQLHSRFKPLFGHLEWRWNAEGWLPFLESELPGQLEQEYRIILMGLAGRAALIYSSAGSNDANAYLDIGRGEYTSINKLTGDISQAVTREEGSGWSLWSDWESEKAVPGEAYSVNEEQYPLAFFSIRLMELLSEPSTTLDLHRRATQIRDWFAANSDGLKGFVQTEQGPRLEPGATTEPSPTLETGPTRDERQQFATTAIGLAVIRDDAAEERDVIQRDLNPQRVSAFIDEIRVAAKGSNPIEESFRMAGTFLLLSNDGANLPEERGWNRLEPKAFLAEDSQTGHIHYSPMKGDRWGRDIAFDITVMFCREIDDGPESVASLDTPENVLKAIDDMMAEFGDTEELLLMWAGDWFQIEIELNREQPKGYQTKWQLQEPQMSWRIGRYRGHPIVRGPRDGERRFYVVDPSSWGILVRGQFEGDQDIRVEINTVSEERANELLELNPDHFPDEPDLESKLRKLQSMVQMRIGIREEVRVSDRSRGRLVRALPEYLSVPNVDAIGEPE